MRAAPVAAYMPNIGRQVEKFSGKPFRNGEKIGTVKGIELHTITTRPAYVFEEDNGQVECWRCRVVASD